MVNVVLVDGSDKVIGYEEKYAAHRVVPDRTPFPLHRAISIVIFSKDKSKILITKRSSKKPTWPLIWSNTVCSHPYDGETYQKAADRRIYEEVGFRTKLSEVFRFTYEAVMDNGVWGEHEYDVVFTGTYDGQVKPNPDEIADYKWVGLRELKEGLKRNPKKYTPWFKIILGKLGI